MPSIKKQLTINKCNTRKSIFLHLHILIRLTIYYHHIIDALQSSSKCTNIIIYKHRLQRQPTDTSVPLSPFLSPSLSVSFMLFSFAATATAFIAGDNDQAHICVLSQFKTNYKRLNLNVNFAVSAEHFPYTSHTRTLMQSAARRTHMCAADWQQRHQLQQKYFEFYFSIPEVYHVQWAFVVHNLKNLHNFIWFMNEFLDL